MRTSSKIILALCIPLLILLVTLFIHISSESQPELNEKDANALLARLAKAFLHENVGEVLSFAAPDAKIAGQTLETIRDYLRRAFASSHNLDVEFRDVQYKRSGDEIILDAHAFAGERQAGSKEYSQTYYNQPVRFVLHRRSTPYLGGLLKSYQWKITEVAAENLPSLERL
jgi:hypothetical protein